MTKRTMLIATLTALMTLPALGSALAKGRGQGPGMGKGDGGGCMGQAMKSANLSPEQKQTLKTLRQQQQERNAPLREQMQAKQAELKALWQAATPDRNAILAKQDEMDSIRRALRTTRIDQRLAAMKVLTPEQRAQVQSQLGTCEGQGGKGKGRHGGHGRGGGFGGDQ